MFFPDAVILFEIIKGGGAGLYGVDCLPYNLSGHIAAYEYRTDRWSAVRLDPVAFRQKKSGKAFARFNGQGNISQAGKLGRTRACCINQMATGYFLASRQCNRLDRVAGSIKAEYLPLHYGCILPLFCGQNAATIQTWYCLQNSPHPLNYDCPKSGR